MATPAHVMHDVDAGNRLIQRFTETLLRLSAICGRATAQRVLKQFPRAGTKPRYWESTSSAIEHMQRLIHDAEFPASWVGNDVY